MKESFNVYGMTCAACQANVTKAVAKLDGVKDVDVSLLGNSMKVDYDEQKVDAKTICDAVDRIGYTAEQKQAPKSETNSLKKEWADRQARVERDRKAAWDRLISSVILMIPLMYVAMGEMLHLPLPAILSGEQNHLINALTQLILAAIIMVIQKHFYIDGFKGLLKRAPNMDSLVALGSGASFVYALAMTYIMAYGYGHGQMTMVHHAAHSLYFDSAAMIVTLVSIGKYLESKSKAKTGDALSKLMDLTPKNTIVIRDGQEVQVAQDQVRVGDIVVMKPGQRVPVDGTVLEGTGYLDQSAITGESIPVEKTAGDEVLSATINENGTFRFKAEKVGDDTTLSQIIRLVDEAGTSKAPIARTADKVAAVFVPIVIGLALATFAGWMIVGGDFRTALNNAISVLVISCPCALGLATPMAIMVGTEKAAQFGILLKNAESLENLHNIQTIVLDKTGTITSGKPSVQDVVNFTDQSDADFLELAAAIEQGSNHPLAEAITAAANGDLAQADAFENISGKGVKAVIGQKTYYAGNRKLMDQVGIAIPEKAETALNDLAEQGKTPMLFADEKQVLGIIAVADTVRQTSAAAIAAFRQQGIHTVMLTGDNAKTARAMADRVGIDEVISDVLPADKEAKIRSLQEKGQFTAMVGDGINDAPALVRADIGIAIGQGTDIAMDSADVVLMKNDLTDVNTAIDLSRAVIRNVHQNLFWALIYNVIGIPLAMGVLTPLTGWTLSPMYGAAAMSLSSIIVCTNAWRLRFFQSKYASTGSKQEAKPSDHKQSEVSSPAVKEEPVVKEKLLLDVQGMMCNHCVASVTYALRHVKGVIDADVKLDPHSALVSTDGTVTHAALEQAVENAGYQVVSITSDQPVKKEDTRMKKQMDVDGMMCEHCQAHVTKALSDVPGVSDVQVSLEKKNATFNAEDSVTDEMLKKAVTDAGYQPGNIRNC
ncbi:MAG: heavy metal translocating P-type ATPase [Catenisphaera adipataccumulans]|jgi:Cu+-exporting ATPase|uniref:heavy metal translocating P-type ATPase n=1 Tax=Catenisphaera adipataccumulans TaxID=700500 RepID=UPI003D8E0026